MGRQSARIYFNGQDHKEMVTWDGTQYVYHDKAYIWTPQGFELVWEKLHGLKLLYESLLPLQPVSSENNKYLYFVENNDASIIYRLKVNDKEPEPEEHYTSDKYNLFSAPVSSRGFGVYAEQKQYGLTYDYSILNLEDGTISEVDTFDPRDYSITPSAGIPVPNLVNQEVSPAESGLGHEYASIFGSFIEAYIVVYNFIYFIAPTGISAMRLDNRDGAGTLILGTIFDLGRLNDGSARGLLPRFLLINSDDSISILEYGPGTQYGMYSASFSDTPEFSFRRVAGGGLVANSIKVVRDDKLPVLATDNHIWFIKVNADDIEYIDTEIEILSRYGVFDISPDYKYALTFEDWNYSIGSKYIKIVDIKTKKVILDVTEEVGDLQTIDAYFVGHNCLYVAGYIKTGFTLKYRLYKWR